MRLITPHTFKSLLTRVSVHESLPYIMYKCVAALFRQLEAVVNLPQASVWEQSVMGTRTASQGDVSVTQKVNASAQTCQCVCG